jgi:choice-of-anchor B domain-containing protein
MNLRLVTLTLLFFITGILHAQQNMSLLSQVEYNQGVNDVWGYVAPDGTEYAIVGMLHGVSIVSLADPDNAEEVAYVEGARSGWRDMKTWNHYAYVTNESSQGVMIIDLSTLPDSVSHTNYIVPMPDNGSINRCHNLFIDSTGHIYLTGCDANDGGIVILDPNIDPMLPPVIGMGPAIYSHDVFVWQNYLFCSEIYAGELAIYDITDLSDIMEVSRRKTPFNFTHNAWTTNDGNYVFTTDERANAYTASYDISDKTEIVALDQFRPLATEGRGVIPHNAHVTSDNFVVISHYTDGVIILDGNKPDNLIQVGQYDTFDGNDGGFSGCWGAYPFLPSGLVLASDRQSGLFVLGTEYVRACYLEGQITDYVTGLPIFDASVDILTAELNRENADLEGYYKTGLAESGIYEVEYTANGYLPATIEVRLDNGVVTMQDVALVPQAALVDKEGAVFHEKDSTPIEGVHVRWLNDDFGHSAFTDSNGVYVFADVVWADYHGAAGAWGYEEKALDTVTVNSDANWPDTYLRGGFADGFFLDQGWMVSGENEGGDWVRAVPIAQYSGNVQTAPGEDVEGDIGGMAYVTGNGGDSAAIDGLRAGNTRLTSPPIDLALYNEPIIRWHQWLYIENPQPGVSLQVGIVQDSVTYELFIQPTSLNGWVQYELNYEEMNAVSGFEPYEPFRMFFEVRNPDSSGIVEAGVDWFHVEDNQFWLLPRVDSTATCPGSSLQFYDRNRHTISWQWTITKDSVVMESNEKTPVFTFAEPGEYTWNLMAVSCFLDTLYYEGPTIQVLGKPEAEFVFIPPSPTGPMVQFYNESNGAMSYLWDFGDGNTSEESDPQHEYETYGLYTVVLIARNICASDTFSMELEVITPPMGWFTVRPSFACVGDTVQFVNQSSGNVINWYWDLYGATPEMSRDTNPRVVYGEAGLYGARLIVESKGGFDTIGMVAVVAIEASPVAGFDFELTERTVQFTNTSTDASEYTWDFNDGNGSSESDPEYTYSADGDYDVTLIVRNRCGNDTATVSITVITSGLNGFVEGDVSLRPNPFDDRATVVFEALLPGRLEVYNELGMQLQYYDFSAGPVSWSLGNGSWAPGMYILVLRNRSGASIWQSRLIKN